MNDRVLASGQMAVASFENPLGLARASSSLSAQTFERSAAR